MLFFPDATNWKKSDRKAQLLPTIKTIPMTTTEATAEALSITVFPVFVEPDVVPLTPASDVAPVPDVETALLVAEVVLSCMVVEIWPVVMR